jgi:hypothetical protein
MSPGAGSWPWLGILRAICAEASGLDLRRFEDGPDQLLYSHLGPEVLELLGRATGLIQELHLRPPGEWEVPGLPGPDEHERRVRDFALKVDALVAQEGEHERLSDLLEMAHFHLSMKTSLVKAAIHRDRWELLDACHSALRGTRKALVALEHVACEICGTPPLLDYQTEVATSLQVRLAFAKFRDSIREVLGGSGPAPGQGRLLQKRLLGGSTALAILVGRDAYPHLRARDRRQIRGLQHKLHATQLAEEPERQRMGEEILADLAAFAELVTLINQREELLQHDKELARAAFDELKGLPPESLPPAEWVAALKPLRGRDPDLDQLIGHPGDVPARLWTALLQPLMGEEQPTQV